MTTVQISFDDLDKLHKDLQQKRERIRFLEVISSADSQQADSHICKQDSLIQSLQNELETAKAVQADYLKFNQNVSNENKKLKADIEKLKATLTCRNPRTGQNTLIGDFKLVNLNSNRSTDSIILSGAYVVEKLDKIQGMASDFVEVDEEKYW